MIFTERYEYIIELHYYTVVFTNRYTNKFHFEIFSISTRQCPLDLVLITYLYDFANVNVKRIFTTFFKFLNWTLNISPKTFLQFIGTNQCHTNKISWIGRFWYIPLGRENTYRISFERKWKVFLVSSLTIWHHGCSWFQYFGQSNGLVGKCSLCYRWSQWRVSKGLWNKKEENLISQTSFISNLFEFKINFIFRMSFLINFIHQNE